MVDNAGLALRAVYETVAAHTGLPSLTPSAPSRERSTPDSRAAAASTSERDNNSRVYHRVESPTQTPQDAARQQRTGTVAGYAARGSDIPTVKAYDGPLAPGQRGIEFTTSVTPASGGVPGQPKWYPGQPGVLVVEGPKGPMALIQADILRNTQRDRTNE